ncbi:MAG: cytochrome c3 family protein [Desulfuromonadales bacterium]|nr:cytochrome c3 family protein [Desulfuromonadales bacterium]MDW7758685.1 cytochrome c3 family protein [Desulfuromonadales bacterium]
MQRKMFALFAVGAALSLALAGCGSNRDSSGSATSGGTELGTDPVSGLAYVGADKCIECHEGFSWSADEVAGFLAGKHVIHSDHIDAASGDCLQCHDPIGDGVLIEGYIDSANVPAAGLAAVTCENCHGAGGEHFGVGPIPNASPSYDACGQCHNSAMDHNRYHPEGDNILEDYVASPHADADGRNEAICVKCHNDEGARMYKAVNSPEGLAVTLPIEGTTHAIQCRTCHDPHVANQLLKGEVTEGHGASEHVVQSSEYATCTNCHQAHDAQIDTLLGVTQLAGSSSTDGASGDLIYHASRYQRVISSSHYDDPETSYANGNAKIEGYTMDPTNERVCRDCHNVHAADTTINKSWAKSGHAGGILEAKEAANADSHTFDGVIVYREAGATDETSNGGFTHYDWDAGNRQDCQMCHTTTGFVNYVADPASYDAANNDFSHLVGWTKDDLGAVTSSGQNELLYCWGCHANNSGALRVQGAVTAPYTYGGVDVVLPESGSSNTCNVCHAGRGNNEIVSTSSRFAGHHAPAAATLYSELTHVGAEFAGLDYSNKVYFAHDSLGADGAGPCVACHMDGDDTNHEFAVVEKDETGVITDIVATNCVGCHDGEHALFLSSSQIGETYNLWNGTALVPTVVTQAHVDQATAELEHESEGYQEAGDILLALLANTITNYSGALIDHNSAVENDLRAFQNSKLTSDEKGGFAHNRYYVKRLIFDSIDYLEDGTLHGTIADYSASYPAGAAWLGTERP